MNVFYIYKCSYYITKSMKNMMYIHINVSYSSEEGNMNCSHYFDMIASLHNTHILIVDIIISMNV